MTTNKFDTLLREAGPLDLGVQPQGGARGFGEVDYLGVGAADEPSPVGSWAQKVRSNLPGGWLAGIPKNDPTPTITEAELRLTYPDATEEELAKLHDVEESRDYGFTLAEVNKFEALRDKWIRSAGNMRQEKRDGLVINTWTRGKEQVCDVTQPDGTCQSWYIPPNPNWRYHVASDGVMACESALDGYQVGFRKTQETFFADCTRSSGLPQRSIPISSKVNGKKAVVGATLEPSGEIRFGTLRGSFKDHQFIAKTPSGVFVTRDGQGKPMLADLNKLPDNIPLNWQDVDRHNAFAQQVARGERSLDEIARVETPQEKAQWYRPPNLSADKIVGDLKVLARIDKNNDLAKTPDDFHEVFAQSTQRKFDRSPIR